MIIWEDIMIDKQVLYARIQEIEESACRLEEIRKSGKEADRWFHKALEKASTQPPNQEPINHEPRTTNPSTKNQELRTKNQELPIFPSLQR